MGKRSGQREKTVRWRKDGGRKKSVRVYQDRQSERSAPVRCDQSERSPQGRSDPLNKELQVLPFSFFHLSELRLIKVTGESEGGPLEE